MGTVQVTAGQGRVNPIEMRTEVSARTSRARREPRPAVTSVSRIVVFIRVRFDVGLTGVFGFRPLVKPIASRDPVMKLEGTPPSALGPVTGAIPRQR